MTTAQAVQIRHVSMGLDYDEGEGYLLVRPDAEPEEIKAAVELVNLLGWEELTVDETGDEPEVWEDGTTKVVLVLCEGC